MEYSLKGYEAEPKKGVYLSLNAQTKFWQCGKFCVALLLQCVCTVEQEFVTLALEVHFHAECMFSLD